MSLFQRIRTPFSELAGEEPQDADPAAYAVGQLLSERRQDLELDLESVGAVLCIKPVYLAALEQGRSNELPGPAYAIGFIRAYASYLGFDGDEVLEAYKADSATAQARPDLALPVPLGERSVPGGPILMVALILALCGYGTWYYLSTGERSRPDRVAPVPAELRDSTPSLAAASDNAPVMPPARAPASGAAAQSDASRLSSGLGQPADLPTPLDADTRDLSVAATPPPSAVPPTAVPDSARGTAPPAATDASSGANAAVSGVDIRALTDCWIQVRAADQSIVFSRVLKTGETYHVPRAGLILRTGNAGALAIAVGGKPAPSIGGVGALRRNVSLDADALLAGTAVRG